MEMLAESRKLRDTIKRNRACSNRRIVSPCDYDTGSIEIQSFLSKCN